MSNLCSRRKKNSKYKLSEFAKLISQLSKTEVIIIRNYKEIEKFLKKNLINDEIIIGMGLDQYQNI